MAELSFGACWIIVAIHPEGRVVLFRPEIGDGGAEVSNMCHIGPISEVPAYRSRARSDGERIANRIDAFEKA